DAAAPTARLTYEADGTLPLYVYARSTRDEDLTLTVVTPDGEVLCNDDADGLQPGLVIEQPASGDYAVWIGSFRAVARREEPGTAELFFSELDGPTAESYDDYDYYDYADGSYTGGEAISLFAAPAHGTLELAPGFASEAVAVEAGGP